MLLEDGYLFLMDRSHDMIISGGENIYPREIEEILVRHPAVHEVAVIGIPDEEWGEAVKAVVSTVDGAEVTDSTLVGPVVVAAGARIQNSTVGPYVAVGEGCAIRGAIVDHSVLMAGAQVSDLDRLTGSVLGREAEVTGTTGDRVDLSLLLGDHSVVDLGRGTVG